MQTLLVAAGVALILIGLLIASLVASSRRGAVAKDDLREAQKAELLRIKAEEASAEERRKNDALR